jgi:hypothetical protein
MEMKQRSRTVKRAALLASTALIALLGACQAPAAGDDSSSAPVATSGGGKPSSGSSGY